MANKMKTLYDQGKALVAPDESIDPSLMAKNKNIDEYKDANVAPTLVISAPSKPSPKDMLNNGSYGTQPGEQRIDTSSFMKPLGSTSDVSYHAEGGKLDKDKINVVGEDGPEEIIGDEVIPLDHTMPKGRSTAPEEEQEGAPAEFNGPVFANPEHMKVKGDTEPADLPKTTTPMDVSNPEKGEMIPGQMQTASTKMSDIPAPVTNGSKEDAQRFAAGLPGTATPEERNAAISGPVVKESSKAPMVPNGEMRSKYPAPESPAPPPEPNQVIADQHAKAMKAKLDAASKGDLVGMGAAIIAGNALPKPEPTAGAIPAPEQGGVVPDQNLGPQAPNMPGYVGKERIGGGTPGEMQVKKDYQNKLADLDQRILTASQVHTPEGKEELGYLQSEKAVLQKMNPLGSAANKPGVLGKIEHGLGVAGNIAGEALIPNVMGSIPGTQANLNAQNEEGAANVEQGEKGALNAATIEAKQDAAKAAANDPKLAGQLLQKGYTIEKDAQGNVIGLKQVEGFENGPKDIKEVYAKAVNEAIAAGHNPADDPKVQQAQAALQAGSKAAAPSSEANLEKAQAVATKVAAAGLPVDAEHMADSLKQAVSSGAITPEEAAGFQGFGAVKTTPENKVTVANATGEARDARKNANTTFTYTDPTDGKVKMAKGSEIPEDVTERTPVKDPSAFINEARQADIIQKSLNHLNTTDLSIFDSPEARSILSVALADTGSMGVGAGPVQVRPPNALENQVKKLMVNSGTNLDDKTRQKVKDYIVDYWAAKDKLMLVQQQIQNGKMGRGTKSFFDAMLSQLPGAQTADKGQAVRQLNDFKETLDTLRDKYPDSYGSYKKEAAAEVNAPSAGNAQYHYNSPKGPIFSNDGKTWYDDKGQKIGK